MTTPLTVSAMRIGRSIRETEAKFDETMISAAQLMQELLTARQHPDVEVHAGQKSIIRLSAAIQGLSSGMTNVFRIHDDMVQINAAKAIMDEDGLTGISDLHDSFDAQAVA
jgi:hypothetical protein